MQHLLGHLVQWSADISHLRGREYLFLVRLDSVTDVNYPLQAALPIAGLDNVWIVLRVISHTKLLVDLVQVGGVDYRADACSILETAGVA
jgi:hypothetical protein